MIFTNLTYMEVGNIIATLLMFMFIPIMIYRMVIAFRHYIYNGDFGDFEKSAFVSLMESEWTDLIKYSYSGYHPGTIVVDSLLSILFSIIMIGAWGPVLIITLLLLLGHIMRKRIAVKQEFINNLKGDQTRE